MDKLAAKDVVLLADEPKKHSYLKIKQDKHEAKQQSTKDQGE